MEESDEREIQNRPVGLRILETIRNNMDDDVSLLEQFLSKEYLVSSVELRIKNMRIVFIMSTCHFYVSIQMSLYS